MGFSGYLTPDVGSKCLARTRAVHTREVVFYGAMGLVTAVEPSTAGSNSGRSLTVRFTVETKSDQTNCVGTVNMPAMAGDERIAKLPSVCIVSS